MPNTNDHCADGAYEIHVTALPDRPGEPITWQNQAVIATDCCAVLLAVIDVLRHHGGVAHFGPMGSFGPVPEEASLLGAQLLEEIRERCSDLVKTEVRRRNAFLN